MPRFHGVVQIRASVPRPGPRPAPVHPAPPGRWVKPASLARRSRRRPVTAAARAILPRHGSTLLDIGALLVHLIHRVPLAALVLAGFAAASAAMPRAAVSQQHPAPAPARDRTADSLRAVIDQGAPRWLSQFHVPSLAVAYVRDGAVAWTRVYGQQAPGVPATGRTLYNVASLTKPVF